MRIRSTLNILLTIQDFYILDSSDIDSVLLDLIKHNYEKICYGGYFIHEVVRIIHRSGIEANQFDLKASFNVNACIEIDCEHFVMYELMTGLPIIKKARDNLILQNDNVLAICRCSAETMDKYNVGDTVPIKVGKCIVNIGDEQIKLNSVFMKPTPTEIAYKLVPAKEKAELTNQIKLLVDLYTHSISRLEEYKAGDKVSKGISATLDWLYPYKEKYSQGSLTSPSLGNVAPAQGGIALKYDSLVEMANIACSASARAGDYMKTLPASLPDVVYAGDKADPHIRAKGMLITVAKPSTSAAAGPTSEEQPGEFGVECVVQQMPLQTAIIALLHKETRFILEAINSHESKLIQQRYVVDVYNAGKR
jgi:hypothetical protein